MHHHKHYQSYNNGGGHNNYYTSRHATRSYASYNPYNYYQHPQYLPHNQIQTINPPPAKRRRANSATWQRESFPRQIGPAGGGAEVVTLQPQGLRRQIGPAGGRAEGATWQPENLRLQIGPPRGGAESATRQPESLPRQIGPGPSSSSASSSRAVSRFKEAEPGLFSRDEIEKCSPSRKDGIDSYTEARLRNTYSVYLKNLGWRLDLPQTTVATAAVLCHRFFHRRSHACHDKFLIATAALFLSSKSEETPCLLNTVLRASVQVCMNPELPSMPLMTHGRDWFEQYRERVTAAEQLILTTLDFEIEASHPYEPLESGLDKLGLARTLIHNLATNFVNEGLRSSLWLQYKPHHIAAGAVFLTFKYLHQDISLYPTFWRDFQTDPRIVEDVEQQLREVCFY